MKVSVDRSSGSMDSSSFVFLSITVMDTTTQTRGKQGYLAYTTLREVRAGTQAGNSRQELIRGYRGTLLLTYS